MVQDVVVFGLHWESKKGGWASREMRLREFFLGKKASRLGKEVVAGGGGFEKSVSNQNSQVWKVLKDHENLGFD